MAQNHHTPQGYRHIRHDRTASPPNRIQKRLRRRKEKRKRVLWQRRRRRVPQMKKNLPNSKLKMVLRFWVRDRESIEKTHFCVTAESIVRCWCCCRWLHTPFPLKCEWHCTKSLVATCGAAPHFQQSERWKRMAEKSEWRKRRKKIIGKKRRNQRKVWCRSHFYWCVCCWRRQRCHSLSHGSFHTVPLHAIDFGQNGKNKREKNEGREEWKNDIALANRTINEKAKFTFLAVMLCERC